MDLRQDPTQTDITNMDDKTGMSIARTDKKHADINEYYRDLAIAAKAQEGCNPEDGANIDLIAMSMAKMTLMQGNVEGGGRPVRQTGGQLIDFMVPMLLLFSGDVNAFFQSAADNADDIINWFAGWWSTLSNCVRGFWQTIFPTGQEHAAAAALLGLGGDQAVREQLTWNYIMGMIGNATTYAMEGVATAGRGVGAMGASVMEGAAAAGRGVGAMGASVMEGAAALSTAVQTKIQPSIDWAKANRVQFGAGIAAMGSNIYLFGDTVAGGAMWLLTFLHDVPLTHWMVATSIIASYLAMRGTGNIDDDRAVIVRIIKAAPADVIVATHTTPAQIKAVQTNIKTYYTEAQTRGLLAAQGITDIAEEGLERAQMGEAAAKQGSALKKYTKGNKDNAQRTIGRMVSDRKAKQAAVAAATRKEKRDTIVAKRRAPAAGSGQTLTSFGFGPSAGAKAGGKRNTKKRSNKKKKTKKHKKKQHRKTKRG